MYQDGSEYKGNFKKGVLNGFGCFWWPECKSNGLAMRHHYKGMWVDGKMQGKGEFQHTCNVPGDTYQGMFVNNLWAVCENKEKFFLNPFDTKEQH